MTAPNADPLIAAIDHALGRLVSAIAALERGQLNAVAMAAELERQRARRERQPATRLLRLIRPARPRK